MNNLLVIFCTYAYFAVKSRNI